MPIPKLTPTEFLAPRSFLFGGGIALIVGIGGYTLGHLQTQSLSQPRLSESAQSPSAALAPASASPSANSSSNQRASSWNVFVNHKDGYSFMYPSDWMNENCHMDDQSPHDVCFGPTTEPHLLRFSVLDGARWDEERQLLGLTLSGDTETLALAGLEGLKRTGTFGEGDEVDQTTTHAILLLKGDNHVLKIWSIEKTGGEDYSMLLKRIYSTISFSNAASATYLGSQVCATADDLSHSE